jgi:hydroxyacylglutathione hydrolase
MKITDQIYLVGSGRLGFDLTDEYDCHVYLLDGGDECVLIDAGAGRDVDAILARIVADGIALSRVRHLLLTHAHADHAGGAAALRERLGLRVAASPETAQFVRAGDEQAISRAAARLAGVYPRDYRFTACPVDVELRDGAVYQVGDLALAVIATPGHAVGQVSFGLRGPAGLDLFCGDTLFHGGKILLQNTWDCSVQDSCRSIERLAALDLAGLYPGHLAFAVQRGGRYVEQALGAIRQLLPPAQLG